MTFSGMNTDFIPAADWIGCERVTVKALAKDRTGRIRRADREVDAVAWWMNGKFDLFIRAKAGLKLAGFKLGKKFYPLKGDGKRPWVVCLSILPIDGKFIACLVSSPGRPRKEQSPSQTKKNLSRRKTDIRLK